jgi:hypothetical protein
LPVEYLANLSALKFEFSTMDLGALSRFVNANATLLVALMVLSILGITGIAIQTILAHRKRDQTIRRSQRVSKIQSDPILPIPQTSGPLVLPNRWLRSGEAATTSDGGCFLYIDRVTAAIESAALTVRVDGEPVHLNYALRVGEQLEASGKYGTYTLKLYAVNGTQAQVAIALLNRHFEAR